MSLATASRAFSPRRLLALAAALVACSGGSSSGKGTAPVIGSLSLWPSSATVGDGGGVVTVQFGASLQDPDADVTAWVATVRDGGGAQVNQVVQHLTESLSSGPASSLNGQLPISTVASGAFTVELQAFDAGGNASNVLQGGFTVVGLNPVPSIAQLTPSTAAAGSGGFTLTVTGTGFVPGSTIAWNGYALQTTYVDASTLRAPVDAYRLSYEDTATVTIANPYPGGGTSAPASFVIGPAVPNPVPTIASVSPASAVAGGPDVTITVTGTGFNAWSRIVWTTATPYASSSYLSTIWLDETTLTGTVSSYQLGSIQTAAISVYNPTPAGGTSSSLAFAVTRPDQPGVSSVALEANDVVWDPLRQRLYLSVPSASPVNPNTVTVLDPATGELTGSAFVGSEPDRLSLSDDGQFLYVALRGASSVERLALPDLAHDLTIALGRDPTNGAYFASDLQVAPGAPHTVAVARAVVSASTSGAGVAIYDDETMRPTAAAPSTAWYPLDSLQWASASTLYAVASYYGTDLYVLAVDASGASVQTTYRNALSSSGGIRLDAGTGLVYGDDGRAIDPATGLLEGTFPVSSLYGTRDMVPDSSLGSAFFVSADGYSSTNALVSVYDLAQYVPVRSEKVLYVGSTVRRLVRWGADGLAFLEPDLVVLVSGAFVAP